MNVSKPFGPAASEISEVDVEDAIGKLSHEHAVIRQGDSADGEMSVAQFSRLLHGISGGSKREIDALIVPWSPQDLEAPAVRSKASLAGASH